MPGILDSLIAALAGGGQGLSQAMTAQQARQQRSFENQIQLATMDRQMRAFDDQAADRKHDNALADQARLDAQEKAKLDQAKSVYADAMPSGFDGVKPTEFDPAQVNMLRSSHLPIQGGGVNGLAGSPMPKPAVGSGDAPVGPQLPPIERPPTVGLDPQTAASLPGAFAPRPDAGPVPFTRPPQVGDYAKMEPLVKAQQARADEMWANRIIEKYGDNLSNAPAIEKSVILRVPHLAPLVKDPSLHVETTLQDESGIPVQTQDGGKTWMQVGTGKPAQGAIGRAPTPVNPEVMAATQAARAAAEGARTDARNDRSYQYEDTQLQGVRKPLMDQADRLGRLATTISKPNPTTDALVAPELLTAMAGGAGSGLRMNEAEIARIVGGRTAWEGIKSAAKRWQLDPNKDFLITPAQRGQIQNLLTHMNSRVQAKLAVVKQAGDTLINSTDVVSNRQAVSAMQDKLSQIESNAGRLMVVDPKGGLHFFDTPEEESMYKAAISKGPR